jgi:hypothetical protein
MSGGVLPITIQLTPYIGKYTTIAPVFTGTTGIKGVDFQFVV